MAQCLPPSQLPEKLRAVPFWRHEGDSLVRKFVFRDFAGALRFTNRIGALAEAANHHPDIDIRWNQVFLRLSTHSAGGLTDSDFDLARQIDSLPEPEKGTPP